MQHQQTWLVKSGWSWSWSGSASWQTPQQSSSHVLKRTSSSCGTRSNSWR